MTKEKLVAVRNQIKSRKPKFKRPQTNQFAKLKNSDKWRKPKGMGNKVRRQRRGLSKMPTVGYGSPSLVRGLNKQGFKEIIVKNKADLDKIKAKDEVVLIAGTVGAKKRLEILAEAKKRNLIISNVKDIDAKIKELTKEKKVKVEKKVEEKTKTKNKPNEKKEVKETKTETEKEIKKETVKTSTKTKNTEEKKTEVSKK